MGTLFILYFEYDLSIIYLSLNVILVFFAKENLNGRFLPTGLYEGKNHMPYVIKKNSQM